MDTTANMELRPDLVTPYGDRYKHQFTWVLDSTTLLPIDVRREYVKQ